MIITVIEDKMVSLQEENKNIKDNMVSLQEENKNIKDNMVSLTILYLIEIIRATCVD